jgi:hypothetical protein
MDAGGHAVSDVASGTDLERNDHSSERTSCLRYSRQETPRSVTRLLVAGIGRQLAGLPSSQLKHRRQLRFAGFSFLPRG